MAGDGIRAVFAPLAHVFYGGVLALKMSDIKAENFRCACGGIARVYWV